MKQWQKEILESTKNEPLAPIFLCKPALKGGIQQKIKDIYFGETISVEVKEKIVEWVFNELDKLKII